MPSDSALPRLDTPSPTGSPPGDSPQPTNVRWLVFALACGTSFLLYLHRYTWGFVKADVAEEFGWDATTLGWLDSAFMVSYAFGQIPSGMLGDWFGPRMVLGGMIGLWSLALGGTALSTGFMSMASTRLLFGLAQAGCYPNLSKVTKLWFPYSVRTTVQGWVASFFGRMGGAVSFVLFGSLLLGAGGMSWRAAVTWLALVGGFVAVLFVLLYRNNPAAHPWSNDAEAQLVVSGDPAARSATGSVMNWSHAFRNGSVRALVLQQFACAYVDNFFSAWVPLYLLTVKHVDLKEAGLLAALPLVGGAVGGMLGGSIQNQLLLWTGNRRWSRSVVGLTGNLMATILLFQSLQYDSAASVMWAFCALKFFADWSQPTTWAATTDMGGRNSASLFAIVNTSGSLAGFIAGPIMGLTIEYFSKGSGGAEAGWRALLVSIGAIYLTAAVLWLFIDCRQTIDPEPPADPVIAP